MSPTSTTTYEQTGQVSVSGLDPESKSADKEHAPLPELPEKPVEHLQPQFPDGGAKAWLVVLGCWCTSFASFGIVNSFG
jgi:hypothetical protein